MQAQLADLKAWLAEEEAKDRAEIIWFDAKIDAYVQALLAAGKVRYGEKSYPLPNGQRIGYHWVEADWTITDPEALFGWAKAKGYVRAHEETDWGEQVKPRLVPLLEIAGSEAVDRVSGETIPGVRLTRPAGDVFVISEGRRRRSSRRLDLSTGAEHEHADVSEHVGVTQDPRVGARRDVV